MNAIELLENDMETIEQEIEKVKRRLISNERKHEILEEMLCDLEDERQEQYEKSLVFAFRTGRISREEIDGFLKDRACNTYEM